GLALGASVRGGAGQGEEQPVAELLSWDDEDPVHSLPERVLTWPKLSPSLARTDPRSGASPSLLRWSRASPAVSLRASLSAARPRREPVTRSRCGSARPSAASA